jgi:hypothetical protein
MNQKGSHVYSNRNGGFAPDPVGVQLFLHTNTKKHATLSGTKAGAFTNTINMRPLQGRLTVIKILFNGLAKNYDIHIPPKKGSHQEAFLF